MFKVGDSVMVNINEIPDFYIGVLDSNDITSEKVYIITEVIKDYIYLNDINGVFKQKELIDAKSRAFDKWMKNELKN